MMPVRLWTELLASTAASASMYLAVGVSQIRWLLLILAVALALTAWMSRQGRKLERARAHLHAWPDRARKMDVGEFR
jgi:hypothetical protein